MLRNQQPSALFFVFGGVVLIAACAAKEDPVGPPPPAEEIDQRPPLTNLGEFPSGPHFPVTGDVYTYAITRTRDTTPGDGSVDSSESGSLRVRVFPEESFGIWNRTYPTSRAQSVGALRDSTVTYHKFDVLADSVADYSVVGFSSAAGTEELAEPRPLLSYPLLTPEEGPDSLTSWFDFSAEVTRWYCGRDDIFVSYDIDILKEEICEDNQGNPTLCFDEAFWRFVAGEIETHLIVDAWITPVAVGAESTWWGRDGMVRSVFSSSTEEETVVTTTRLTGLRTNERLE